MKFKLSLIIISLLLAGQFCPFAYAKKKVIPTDEPTELKGKEAIKQLQSEFNDQSCSFKKVYYHVVGSFDPLKYYKFQTDQSCIEQLQKDKNLKLTTISIRQQNYILAARPNVKWWRPSQLKTFVYSVSEKSKEHNEYHLLYDATTQTAYLYIQNY